MNNIYKTIIWTVFTMVFLVNGVYAYNITGYINTTSGIGISGAVVCVYNVYSNSCQNASTSTDSSGYYKISNLVAKTYYVKLKDDDRDKQYFYIPLKNSLSNIAPNLVSKITVSTNINNVNFTKYNIDEARSGFKFPMNFNPYNYGYTYGQFTGDSLYHPGQDYNSYGRNGKCYNGSKETPIYATADGTIVDMRQPYNSCSGWGAVVVKHFYKGKAYYSQYGHMYINDPISVGQKVTKGKLLGYEDGIPSYGMSFFDPHLHLEIRNAKHPRPYDRDYWDVTTTDSLTLKNLNNTDKYYEHPDAFIDSSGPYTDLPAIFVDERELLYYSEYALPNRFFSVNDKNQFKNVPLDGPFCPDYRCIQPSIGYGSHFQYTPTTTGSIATAWGRWTFNISKEGYYEINVYIPNTAIKMPNLYKPYKANYKLDNISISAINQSNSKDWTELGIFYLKPGRHNIQLNNNNGESGKNLVYDAIKIVYSTERRITTNAASQTNPAIYGNRIVYQDFRNGNSDIYMYDLSTNTERRITTNTASQYDPKIYGNRIVYHDNRNGNDDIYMYDLSVSTNPERRITNNTANQMHPVIYGNRIVWTDERNIHNYDGNADIYMYDLSASTNPERRITTNAVAQYNPAIYENRIVWEDYRNGNADIYMYDLSASTNPEKRITTNTAKQSSPSIYGNRIVYQDYRNGNVDIYMYDLSASTNPERRITNNTHHQWSPVIYGNSIVWEDDRDVSIYMYDLSASTNPERRITTNVAGQINPAIYGNRIVYQDFRNGNSDIYMYTI